MYCENNFCIYCEDNKCILDIIELDISGVCTSCILVKIDEKLLSDLKRETRNKLDNL